MRHHLIRPGTAEDAAEIVEAIGLVNESEAAAAMAMSEEDVVVGPGHERGRSAVLHSQAGATKATAAGTMPQQVPPPPLPLPSLQTSPPPPSPYAFDLPFSAIRVIDDGAAVRAMCSEIFGDEERGDEKPSEGERDGGNGNGNGRRGIGGGGSREQVGSSGAVDLLGFDVEWTDGDVGECPEGGTVQWLQLACAGHVYLLDVPALTKPAHAADLAAGMARLMNCPNLLKLAFGARGDLSRLYKVLVCPPPAWLATAKAS